MSYTPQTDFLAIARLTSSGVRQGRMPGLDFVVDALARMGLINLSIGQTAPTANQATTAWFVPSSPSWVAEGSLFLWNSVLQQYQLATPALWIAFLGGAFSGYSFQSIKTPGGVVLPGTSVLAIQRATPAATALVLPGLVAQFTTGRKLQIVDFSTAVANHAITVTTPDGATIMQQNSLKLLSTAAQLAGVMLQPSPDLNSWIIAP